MQEALEAALAAGRALLEAKELVPHGQWQAWLYANLPGISVRTAQRYMLAAERSGKNDTVSFSSLRELTRPAGEFNLATLPMRVLCAVGMNAVERIEAGFAAMDNGGTEDECWPPTTSPWMGHASTSGWGAS